MTAFVLLGLGETAALFVTQGLGIGAAVVLQYGPIRFAAAAVYSPGLAAGDVYAPGLAAGDVIYD